MAKASKAASTSNVIAAPRPSNIYTIFAGVGLRLAVLTLVVIWSRGSTLFGGLLTESPQSANTPGAPR